MQQGTQRSDQASKGIQKQSGSLKIYQELCIIQTEQCLHNKYILMMAIKIKDTYPK